MKNNLKTKVMLALLAGGMLCANGAWAANWYGTTATDNKWTTVAENAVTSGLTLTIKNETEVDGKNVTDLSSSDNIYGGYTDGSEDVKNNSITFDTTYTTSASYVRGGYSKKGGAKNNKVTVNNGTINGQIYGGWGEKGTVEGNLVTINRDTLTKIICGGKSNDADYDVKGNSVIVNGGKIQSGINGGIGGGNVTGNKVIIEDGKIIASAICGGNGSGTSNATENEVTIKGGTFSNSNMKIYGATSGGDATGNTVTIEGGTFNDVFSLYGGKVGAGTSSNNTLNLKTAIAGTAKEVNYFQKVNFTLPAGATSDVTMLKVGTTPMALAGITFTTDLNGLSLTGDDYITLIRGVNGTAGPLDAHTNYYILGVGGVNELVYSNGTPTPKGDYTIKQGNSKFDSGTTGNYIVQINGNTTDGGLSSTSYSNNEVIIRRGTYDPSGSNIAIAGAYNTTTDEAISNNTVKIYDGTFNGDIYGGDSINGEVNGNIVNIYGGTIGVGDNARNIYGGYSITNSVTGNVTNIEGGTFAVKALIRGGASIDGSVTGNKLNIENGTFTASDNEFYGGYSNNGNVEGNSVTIEDGTFSGSIYGGYSGGGDAKDNTVTIEGGTFADGYKLYGGYTTGTSTNNTLNLKTKITGKAAEVKFFQEMNFTLPSGITADDKMLSVTNAVSLNDVTLNVYLNDYTGQDTITLIDSVSGTGIYKVYTGTEGSTHALTDDYAVVMGSSVLYLKLTELWYRVGGTNKKFLGDDTAKTLNETEDVVLYRGAGDDNKYTSITTTGSLTVGAETEVGKSFTVTGDLKATEGVTVQTKNTLIIDPDNLKSAVTNNGTVTLNYDGTLAAGSTITGGTLNINGDVSANAGDIAGNINTVASGKNLTLTDGELAKPVGGAGNVVVDGEVSSSAANFANSGTLSVTGTGTLNLSLNVDMSNFTSNILAIDELNGSVVVNSINIIKDINAPLVLPNTEDNKILYLTKTTGDGTTAVKDSASTVTNDYKYTFTAGDFGKLNYKVEATDLTFKNFVEGTLRGYDTDPATLSMTADLANTGADITTITMGDNQSNDAITVNLNGHNLTSGSASTVTINGGKTFNLNGGNETTGGTVDANTNFSVAGTLAVGGKTNIKGNITNTGTVTFADTTAVEGILSGTGAYSNSGTLTIADASKLQMTDANGLVNNGTVILGNNTLDSKITGGSIQIAGEVTSSANNLQGTISVNQDCNMYLTDGTLTHAVTGDGWVNVSTSGDNEVTIAADVSKLKNQGRMKVSGSQPVTFTNANFAAGSTLTLNAGDCVSAAPINIATGGSITVDPTAVLCLEGAVKGTPYKIIKGVDSTFLDSDWDLSNIQTVGLKVSDLGVVGDVYQITFKSCVPENTMLKNLLADGKNNKLMDWAEGVTDMYGGDEVLATNEINAMAAMGENLGVTRGALDVTRMVGVSVADHLFAKNLTVKERGGLRNVGSYGKDNSELNIAAIPAGKADDVMPRPVEEVKYGSGNTWARFTHNRVKVDGMHTGDMKSQYSAQYNGVSVGYDLVDDQDITLGVALHYADGNASNGFGGHNDSTYTGGSVYAQKLMGKVVVSGEVTYLHGKNEMDQAGVTAKARTNTVSVGFDVRQPIKVGKGYVTPFTGMRYNHVQNKGYTDSLNTNRSSNNVSNFVTPVGVRYSVTIDKFYGWTVQPFAEIGYLFNYGDKGSDMKLRYGTAEDTFGFDVVDKNTFFTRAGMNFGKKNLTIGLGYDYMKSSNSNNNKWNVNLTYSF